MSAAQLHFAFLAPPDAIVAGLIDPAVNEWSRGPDGLHWYTSRATAAQFRQALALLPDALRVREVVLRHNLRMVEREEGRG